MAKHHPDLHPHLVDLWQEYVRRERNRAEDPMNRFAYREVTQAIRPIRPQASRAVRAAESG